MPVAVADQVLYDLISTSPPTTIEQVIEIMQQIDDCIPNNNGLKWFNRLYLAVTRQVDLQPVGDWKDPSWLIDLDVVFAGFLPPRSGRSPQRRSQCSFFMDRDVRSTLSYRRGPHTVCPCWHERPYQPRPCPRPTGGRCADRRGPRSRESAACRLSGGKPLLNSVMFSALQMLAADTLGVLAEDTGKIGRLLAFWDICRARDLAWDFANHLRDLSGVVRQAALDAQDQITGA
jgi:hypothetical protein